MTISASTTSEEKDGSQTPHCEGEFIVSNEERYLSSCNAKLNCRKWDYDLDTESFLQNLPKVSVEMLLQSDGKL